MPEKKYLIEIPGHEDQALWDADKFERNKDQLFKDHSDAIVAEIDAYSEDDVQDTDSYLIHVDGFEDGAIWDAEKFARNKEQLLKDHPTAQIQRVRGYDYFYNQAMDTEAALKAKKEEYAAWQRERAQADVATPSTLDLGNSGVTPVGHGFRLTNDENAQDLASRGITLEAEIERLQEQYDNNPRVKAAREEQERAYAEYKKQYPQMLREQINKDYEDFLATVPLAKRSEVKDNAFDDVGLGRAIDMLTKGKEYREQQVEYDMVNPMFRQAFIYIDEADRIRNAPSVNDDTNGFVKYLKGMGNKFSSVEFWSRGMNEVDALAAGGNVAITKFQKLADEKGDNLTADDIDKTLNPAEKAFILALMDKISAQAERANEFASDDVKISRAYKWGEGTADMVGYMAEFLLSGSLTGGIGGKATKAVSKWLLKNGVSRMGKKAIKGLTGKAAAKAIATNAAKSAGKALTGILSKSAGAVVGGFIARTPFTLGLSGNIAARRTSLDEDGRFLDMGESVVHGVIDTAIENFSEEMGGAIGDMLGLPFKAIKGGWKAATRNVDFGKIGGAAARVGNWAERIGKSNAFTFLRKAGFHGPIEELGEEFVGAAVRELTIEPGAWGQMANKEAVIDMLVTFAPMTVLGIAGTAAEMNDITKQAKEKVENLLKLMDKYNFSKEQKAYISDFMRSTSAEKLTREMAGIWQTMSAESGFGQEFESTELGKAVLEAAFATARYQTLFGKKQAEEQQQRDAKRIELEDKYKGRFYGNDNMVRRHILKDGRLVFQVTGFENGEAGAINAKDGSQITIQESDIAETKTKEGKVVKNSSSQSLDSYLSGEIMALNMSMEEARMQKDRNDQIAALYDSLPSEINMGTEGTPDVMPVKEKNSQGVTLVDKNGNEIQLSWEQVGQKLGKPIKVLTDAEITEIEEKEIALRREARRAQKAQTNAEVQENERDIARTQQEIENMTPAPEEAYRNQETGEIDENAFWENDPEGWAEYNDRVMNDGGQDTIEQIDNGLVLLNQQMAQLNKMAIDSPNARKAVKAQKAQLQEKINRLTTLQQKYVQQAEQAIPEDQRRAELTLQMRERLAGWRKRLGLTDEQLVSFESTEDILNSPLLTEKGKLEVLQAIDRGRTEGWYNTASTRAFVFLPDINSAEELDKTVAHEVVAHYGLHTLMGEKAYNELMDKVWDMMSDAAKRTYYYYPGVVSEKDADKRRRMAAEEFVAHVGEQVSLGEVTAEQKSLWQRIVDWFRNLFKESNFSDVDIADIVRRNYQQLTEQAAKESVEEFKAEAQEQAEQNASAPEVIENGTNIYSTKTYREGGRDYLAMWLQSDDTLSEEERKYILDTMDFMYNAAEGLAEKYSAFGAWSEADVVRDAKGDPIMSVIKANGDYAMNLDFSLVCKKRRALNALLNKMIKDGRFDGMVLREKEIARINQILQKHGFEVACALCFVDAKRYRVANVATQFTSMYNDLVKSLIPKSSGYEALWYNYMQEPNQSEEDARKNPETVISNLPDEALDWTRIDKILKRAEGKKQLNVEEKIAKLLKSGAEYRRLASASDFISDQGFELVTQNNPELLKLYNAKKGTGGPKASLGDVQYLNNIAKSQAFSAEKAYKVGGVRIQSFSDYMPHMFFDYMQMMAELAGKRLPAHAYTKEPAFARLFGMTGMKINLSLVPRVDMDGIAPGLDAEGNYTWAVEYVDEEGRTIATQTFPPEVAFEMQQDPRYSGNVGAIAVGISDEHILKMLGDPNIHFVIPYHKSSLNPDVAKMAKIDQYSDYTKYQTEKLDPSHPNAPKGKLTAAQKKAEIAKRAFDFYGSLAQTNDPKKTAADYLSHCKEVGLIPKFPQFANNENYYKLLVDFNTYDFVTGEYAPQGAVTMTFPDNMLELIEEGLVEDQQLDDKLNAEISEVAEEVYKEIGTNMFKTKHPLDTTNKSTTFAAITPEVRREMDVISAQAIVNGNYMKAPNGKDTKLTPDQWALVRTKNFIKWFGDWTKITRNEDGSWNIPEGVSHVIDQETGEPMVVYHGTKRDFTVFGKDKEAVRDAKKSHTEEDSHYFNDNKEVAKTYGEPIEAFLNMENPLIVDFEGRSWRNEQSAGVAVYYERTGDIIKNDFKSIEEAEAWREQFLKENPSYEEDADYVTVREDVIAEYGTTSDEYVKQAKEQGYDGVIMLNITDSADIEHVNTVVNDYVAFEPNQIKSATDNTGEFSEDEDIRFRFIGKKGAANIDKATQETWTLDNLARAQKMESKFDAKTIKRATGWEKGVDGKWRYEEPDNITLKEDKVQELYDNYEFNKKKEKSGDWGSWKEESCLLPELIDAPELFRAYPELKTLYVRLNDRGFASSWGGTIVVNVRFFAPSAKRDGYKSINDLLLHELQHEIQKIEGFAKGGSIDTADQIRKNAKVWAWKLRAEEVAKKHPEFKKSEVKKFLEEEFDRLSQDDWMANRDALKEGTRIYTLGQSSWNNYAKDYELLKSIDESDYETYYRLAGEVEARNVTARAKMSSAERKYRLASETEDRDRSLQIVSGVTADEDIRFKTVYGGNRGYVGYSMSKRAAEARSEGRYPKTDFRKEYNVTAPALDLLEYCGIIDGNEWHHTSMYGNRTTFYGWYEDEYANIYQQNKKEIDALAREYKKKKEEYREAEKSTRAKLFAGEITPQDEFELSRDADKEYNQYEREVQDKIDAIFNPVEPDGSGDETTMFKTRTAPAPTKTQEVYKLMRLGSDGKLYPLFIGSAEPIELGTWYDAESPNLGDLTKLASGVHLVNNETGEAMTLDEFKAQHPEITIKGKRPNVAAINWATENGARWIEIEDKATAQRRYEGESRSYYNLGINGSGQVGQFAMRPGWHAGSLPTMRQIGKGKDKNLRDDSFVWVKGRIPADVDYQSEADANPDKDIPTHIPTDGFYMKATNANAKASQADKMGWYVAGSFIADEIISDAEARSVIDSWNAEHPDAKVKYDYERESGREYDPKRGGLVEAGEGNLYKTTYDNYYKGTSGVWQVISPSEVPNREPDYTSTKFMRPDLDSSRYWYGTDEGGDYVIRESDHWSSLLKWDKSVDRFNENPWSRDYAPIASSRWALDIRGALKDGRFTIADEYLNDGKAYGKAYLADLTRPEGTTLFKTTTARALRGLVTIESSGASFESVQQIVRSRINGLNQQIDRLNRLPDSPHVKSRLAAIEEELEVAKLQESMLNETASKLIDETLVEPDYDSALSDMTPRTIDEAIAQALTMSVDSAKRKVGVMLKPESLAKELGWNKDDWKGMSYIVSDKGVSLDRFAEMLEENSELADIFSGMDTMEIKDAIIDFLMGMSTYSDIRDFTRNARMREAREEAEAINNEILSRSEETRGGLTVEEYNSWMIESDRKARRDELEVADAMTADISDIAEQIGDSTKDNTDAARATLMDKLRNINQKIASLRSIMAAQKEYDKATVKTITDIANDLLTSGALTNVTRGEVKKILSIINGGIGKKDMTVSANRLIDLMINNQLSFLGGLVDKFMKARTKKVNASGVEIRGEVDAATQKVMDAFRRGMKMEASELENAIIAEMDKMSSPSETIRNDAGYELSGLQFAKRYYDDVRASMAEEGELIKEIKDTKKAQSVGLGFNSNEDYRAWEDAVRHSIRENKMERISALQKLVEDLSRVYTGGVESAKLLKQEDQARIQQIQHYANSDMQGMPANEHVIPNKLRWNNFLTRFILAPLATFDQMLRQFGRLSPSGEGYLWNHFMRNWLESTENEYKGVKAAYEALDKEAQVMFGNGVRRWSDLFAMSRKTSPIKVKFWDGGEIKEHVMTIGNLLYIYMVNKMTDGKTKLRKMGISEEDVADIAASIAPELIAIADWIQESFLPGIRDKYNAVHERLFGAPMAAIDNYFPLKVNPRARTRDVDTGISETEAKPSTITGSIIKRTRNSLALDVMNVDAIDLVLEHIQQMEHWAAFAEFNQDLNALLSYRKFRTRVENMSGIYGSGTKAWETFRHVAELAAGVYQPASQKAKFDMAAVNIAKGVTGAKISFRVYTALKQLLSMPAFISDARTDILAKNLVTPWASWNWAMENLPLFEKRWKSRQAGDSRLMATESDLSVWKNKIVETAARWGMAPNALVDAVTVAIGARSIYETKKKRYIEMGYAENVAEKRAKQDATILFNESQQSNESAFLSTMQVDRTVFSVMFTIFRNSSMGYQRMFTDAIRNLKHKLTKGNKEQSIEFIRKQLIRDGIEEAMARRTAERIYGRSFFKDAMRVVTFGFVVQFAWNLGAYLPYLLFGDDDDEKVAMIKDAAIHGLIGGPVEGLSGGSIISEVGNMIAKGDDFKNYNPTLLPIVSDFKRTLEMLAYDEVAAVNEMFNLAVQAGIGVNPQTLTDIGVAIYDACNGDLGLATEVTLALMRVLQAPQSQIDKMLMDEINFKDDRGLEMTIAEFAKRYAEYKVLRGAPVAGWLYSDEKERQREDQYIRRFYRNAEEARRTRGNEEAKKFYEYLDTEYTEVTKTMEELSREMRSAALRGDRLGAEEFAHMLEDFMNSDIFKRYAKYGAKAGAVKKLRDQIVKVDSTSRSAIENAMLQVRKEMVEEMDANN